MMPGPILSYDVSQRTIAFHFVVPLSPFFVLLLFFFPLLVFIFRIYVIERIKVSLKKHVDLNGFKKERDAIEREKSALLHARRELDAQASMMARVIEQRNYLHEQNWTLMNEVNQARISIETLRREAESTEMLRDKIRQCL